MRMYLRGATIRDIDLLLLFLNDGLWVYYRGRPKHPSIIYNMTLQTVLGGLEAGVFAEAIFNEEEGKNVPSMDKSGV